MAGPVREEEERGKGERRGRGVNWGEFGGGGLRSLCPPNKRLQPRSLTTPAALCLHVCSVFAGGGDTRMPAYKVAMALGIGGAAWWWWSQQKDVAQKQGGSLEMGACGRADGWKMRSWGPPCLACAAWLTQPAEVGCACLPLPNNAEAAVEQFGAHGEKTEYGKSFQQTVQVCRATCWLCGLAQRPWPVGKLWRLSALRLFSALAVLFIFPAPLLPMVCSQASTSRESPPPTPTQQGAMRGAPRLPEQ